MPLFRRDMLRTAGAAGAALCLPGLGLAAQGPRLFDLYRGRSKIGEQTLTVTPEGRDLGVAVNIDISVRILGLPAYRYRLESREIWSDGRLRRLDARCNDNGTDERVSALSGRGGVEVDGTAYQGVVDGNPATTTYWSQAFLERPVWISTQNGLPFNVSCRPAGPVRVPAPEGDLRATRWQVRGDIGRLDLFYDDSGEWVGNEFEARGQEARLVLARRGRNLADLWRA